MKIFTIGSVWNEFVKRLPRTTPRFHDPKRAEQQAEQARIFADMMRPMSEAQMAQMAMMQRGPYYPGGLGSCPGSIGNIFNGL